MADGNVQRLAKRTPAQLGTQLGVGYVDIVGGDHAWQRILMRDTAVAEAFRTDCPLAAAAAMLMLETSGGKNIYGHDAVTCAEPPYQKGGPVTRENYAAYKARRGECGMQGVGPAQLTWHTFQDDADRLGGCWQPEINCRIGFGLLGAYIYQDGYHLGFKRYNTGSSVPGPSAYADRAMLILPRWQKIVSGGTGGAQDVKSAVSAAAAAAAAMFFKSAVTGRDARR